MHHVSAIIFALVAGVTAGYTDCGFCQFLQPEIDAIKACDCEESYCKSVLSVVDSTTTSSTTVTVTSTTSVPYTTDPLIPITFVTTTAGAVTVTSTPTTSPICKTTAAPVTARAAQWYGGSGNYNGGGGRGSVWSSSSACPPNYPAHWASAACSCINPTPGTITKTDIKTQTLTKTVTTGTPPVRSTSTVAVTVTPTKTVTVHPAPTRFILVIDDPADGVFNNLSLAEIPPPSDLRGRLLPADSYSNATVLHIGAVSALNITDALLDDSGNIFGLPTTPVLIPGVNDGVEDLFMGFNLSTADPGTGPEPPPAHCAIMDFDGCKGRLNCTATYNIGTFALGNGTLYLGQAKGESGYSQVNLTVIPV